MEYMTPGKRTEIIAWIEIMHNKYLEAVKAVKIDCQYIVELSVTMWLMLLFTSLKQSDPQIS